MSDTYTPTIGIEIHCQLNTKTKMFCPCDNDSRGVEPNTNICPICLGYPGSLPSINHGAIEKAIQLGLGLNATIAEHTKFDRKNYFYPDLPKGYQISQFDMPIVAEGSIEILVDGEFQKVGIERAHLEEDAAKLIHPAGADYSLVDYNRGGTPLVEIVSKPDMHSPAEARRYVQEVYNIAMALGVSEGNMEDGNFKFDLNVSVSTDPNKLGTKVELKNLNSFRYAERALAYEIKRQTELLQGGGTIDQETRGYNDTAGTTFSQRGKEEAHDYRYFPEPDLPPLLITETMIAEVRAKLPILPIQVRKQLVQNGVGLEDQDVLLGQAETLALFSASQKSLAEPALVKKALNWLVGDYQALLLSGVDTKLTSEHLVELVRLVADDKISSKIAKQIFAEVVAGAAPAQVLESRGLVQMSDSDELSKIVNDVVSANPQAKVDFAAGKERAVGFLVGQVMQQTQGQANPSKVNELIRQALNS